MDSRTAVPRRRQMLGAAGAPAARAPINNCEPYLDQPVLPRNSPGTIPPADSNPTEPQDTRQRFHRFASIVCPAPANVFTQICEYDVPLGHQAAVVGLLVHYEGTGFVEGDASLLFFALRLNGNQFVSDYNSIPNTLGSLPAGPWPIPGRLKIFAGDKLEILVQVPVGSTIATGGTNRVHGHLVGYYWPTS